MIYYFIIWLCKCKYILYLIFIIIQVLFTKKSEENKYKVNLNRFRIHFDNKIYELNYFD